MCKLYIHHADVSDTIIADNIISNPVKALTDSGNFTYDAIALDDGKPVIANPQFTLDIEQATESMEKLLSLKAKAYYCYHGGLLCSPEH